MRVQGNGDAAICHASLLAAGNTHVTSPSLSSRCHHAAAGRVVLCHITTSCRQHPRDPSPCWLTGATMLVGSLSVLLGSSFLGLASSQTITVPSGNSIFTPTGPLTVSATYPQPATSCALNLQASSDASACAPVAATNGTWRSAAALPCLQPGCQHTEANRHPYVACRQSRATFYGGPESYLSHFADRGPPPGEACTHEFSA